ncbi:MAG: PTS sugar transporter subunit IIA [Spirochaetes bacterium]|nr:PTS sugar transporter subunit IIA [Spirochaetota bacterium]
MRNELKKRNYILNSISYIFLNIFIYNVFFIFNIKNISFQNINYIFYIIGGLVALIFSISLIETNILVLKKNADISLNIKIMGPFFGNIYSFIRLFFLVIRFILIFIILRNIILDFFNIQIKMIYFSLIFIILLFLFFLFISNLKFKEFISIISRYIIIFFLILFLISTLYLFFYYLTKNKINIEQGNFVYFNNMDQIIYSLSMVIFSFSTILDLFITAKIDIKKKRFFLIYIIIAIFVIINILSIFIYFYELIYINFDLLSNFIKIISILFLTYILFDNFFSGIRVIDIMIEEKILPSIGDYDNKEKNILTRNVYYFIIFSLIFLFIVNLNFIILIKTALIFLMLIYLLSNLSSIILKENYSQGKLSNLILYPKLGVLFNIISIIFSLLFIVYLIDKSVLFFTVLLLFISFLVFILYGLKKIGNISLLKNIVAKVLNREIELKDIDYEIDKILFSGVTEVKDKFDYYVQKSDFIDIEEDFTLEEFFLFISEIVSKKLNINKDVIYNLFVERERISSCALNEFVAIPHIIIDGTNKFEIIFIRAKNGIPFKDKYKVKAIFVLIGTRDQRNFHLQVLASIAQLVMDEDFEENWLRYEDINELRKFILKYERKKLL